MEHKCFTAECLWILLRSMVMSLIEKRASVYSVICSIEQCDTPAKEAVRRMEEFVKAGNGHFKILYTQTDGEHDHFGGGETGEHLSIALDSASQEIAAWKEGHIQSRIQDLVREDASWNGLTELALVHAREQPANSTYLLIKVNMILLEWTTKGCTRKQVKEKLQQPPSSLQDCYDEAIGTIKKESRTWVLIALRWIACAVRPLRPAELAVAVALSEISGLAQRGDGGESKDMSGIKDMIRRDILGDMRHCMAPLIKVENNRVCFIHPTFEDFLLTHKPIPGHSKTGKSKDKERDVDCQILEQCLQYLKHVGPLALSSIHSDAIQHFLPNRLRIWLGDIRDSPLA
ncbi:hypothetical protein B0T17DRAFT_320115 [Bombardia bombarda]|uniref:Uncharacterized protein n=1 Tax=Bombardia bombarda TaxID=252184 RepID=A0AA40BYA9_9PEZI|nr:hypothetical protein B0T17DRAFT_320115 [Bombardia bombarda]